MIDNDIIKAAKCCMEMKCVTCPLQTYSFDPQICKRKCKSDLFELASRLKEENDSLRKQCAEYEKSHAIKNAISAAFSKFFNEAREVAHQSMDWSHGDHPTVVEWDDLVEIYMDMVGGSDDR